VNVLKVILLLALAIAFALGAGCIGAAAFAAGFIAH
jgi:hypothetical protein